MLVNDVKEFSHVIPKAVSRLKIRKFVNFNTGVKPQSETLDVVCMVGCINSEQTTGISIQGSNKQKYVDESSDNEVTFGYIWRPYCLVLVQPKGDGILFKTIAKKRRISDESISEVKQTV